MMQENKNGILLESGTNEIEIMEFTINDCLFGINVAKVREIMLSAPVKPMPHTHPSVEGVFKPRDIVITVIDLPQYLSGGEPKKGEKDLFIVTNFNKIYIAFRVHTVVGISRISWTDIQKPDKTVAGGAEGVATGIAQYNDELVTILDFEKIVADISAETSIQISEIDELGEREPCSEPIYIAEDSALLAHMIEESLHKARYTNLRIFSNGQEMWDNLQQFGHSTDLRRQVALIITDLEMPQMDGHRLIKLIKDHGVLKQIPIIIFSSLISEEMRIKGKKLGADEQLSKPEIGNLVGVMDRLLGRTKR